MRGIISTINRILSLTICLALVALIFAPATAIAKDSTEKTVVRVGWFDSEFNQFDSYGRRAGYSYEYQQKIAGYTGWEYEYVEGSWDELYAMLERGEIDLLSVVEYTPEREGKVLFSDYPMGYDEYNINAAKSENPYYFAVNKDREDIQKALSLAMAEILDQNKFYHQNLYKKYLDTNSDNKNLSADEIKWIKENKVIRVGYRDNYLAFCAKDSKTGELTGALGDCLDYIESEFANADIKFEAVAYPSTAAAIEALHNGEVDCAFPICLSAYDAEQQNLLVTEKLMGTDMYAIISEKCVDFSTAKDYNVAVNNGNPSYLNFVIEKFPHWNIKYYADTEACFKAVSEGECDCVLVSSFRLYNVRELCSKYGLTDVATGEIMELSLAVERENTLLYSILNKAISAIPDANVNAALTANSIRDKDVSLGRFIRENFVSIFTVIILTVLALAFLLFGTIKSEKRAKSLNVELKKNKKELEEALVAANAANQAKTTFLNNMSHDIRTPMNAILGFTELMEKNLDDREKLSDYLGKIKSSGEFLLSLINNVLEMAKIESGKSELDEKPVNILEAHKMLDSVFQGEMAKKNIKFIPEIDVVHNLIYMDETKVTEIFSNLLSNAVKYTPQGGTVKVLVKEIESVVEGSASFKIIIADNGIGMSKEYLPHIYDSFVREHNTTEIKILGTGLGLPIVKKLVDLMGGKIEVESELGVGTTFVLYLTHRICTDCGIDYLEEKSDTINIENLVGKRILLAEDNDLNAEIAITILQEAGAIVERAEDGIICVDKITNAKAGYFDCVLMDIQMPNMDGYQATFMIRSLGDEQKKNIPIIAMTANAFEEDKRKAFETGMNAHLAKPIKVEEVLKTLSEFIK